MTTDSGYTQKNVRVNLAITNNLGNVLFRGEAVSGVRDSDRTSPTAWVHFRSLSPEIIEKKINSQGAKRFWHPSVHD